MAVRSPAVAGTFYPEQPTELENYVKRCLPSEQNSRPAKAVILPHAGYIYSGQTAGKTLAGVSVPERVILIGPNHHGIGAPFAVYPRGIWQIPSGDVPIAETVAKGLVDHCGFFLEDTDAHRNEHSLEVEIPFLFRKNPKIKIVPVLIGTLNLSRAREAALCFGEYLSRLSGEFLVAVSTDMNHYEDDAATRIKDRYALDAIKNLDVESFIKAVRGHQISMCGFVPVYMLLAMKDYLKIKKATLVDYRTSADAGGESHRVVGYAGFIFE